MLVPGKRADLHQHAAPPAKSRGCKPRAAPCSTRVCELRRASMAIYITMRHHRLSQGCEPCSPHKHKWSTCPGRLVPRHQSFRVALSPCRYHPTPRPRRREPVAKEWGPTSQKRRSALVINGQGQAHAARAGLLRGNVACAPSLLRRQWRAARRRAPGSLHPVSPPCRLQSSARHGASSAA